MRPRICVDCAEERGPSELIDCRGYVASLHMRSDAIESLTEVLDEVLGVFQTNR